MNISSRNPLEMDTHPKPAPKPAPEPVPKPPSTKLSAPIQMMSPIMNRRTETIFSAELCDLLKEPSSFTQNVSRAFDTIGALPGTVRIRLLDGTKNGSPTWAAVVHFRHLANSNKETIFVVIRGSGDTLREKWLMEHDCEPAKMSQTRGVPMIGTNQSRHRNIWVHRGVLRGYRSIQMGLRDIVKKCPAQTKLVITGYGFGGAIANVAALDLANRNHMDPYHADIQIRLVTFGTPHYFADHTFHSLLMALVSQYTSYSGAWDPITRMSSKDSLFTRPLRPTIWLHRSERNIYETRSITLPMRVTMGCWPLCCGCGPRDDPVDHNIQIILNHLRVRRN
jgi:hypothetical protein